MVGPLLAKAVHLARQSAPLHGRHFELYARDQRAFFADYSEAHKKLSELGSKFDPPQGILL